MVCTPQGCQTLRHRRFVKALWYPCWMRVFLRINTGGLRLAATTGYFLATLRVVRVARCRQPEAMDTRE
jgi:hypothetical protein